MNTSRIRRQLGITLLESLATVAISGVLVGIGVPGFSHLIAENRLVTEVNTLVSHVQLARSEAVKRLKPAILCPSDDGQTCLRDPQWHRGYILFIDENRNRARDENEPLIRQVAGERDGPVSITSSRSRRLVRFQGNGIAAGTNLTVTFCHVGDNAAGRAVVISNTGRPRVTKKTSSGDPISCG